MPQTLKAAIKGLLPEQSHMIADILWSQVTWPLYAGSQVSCPVCGGSFRKFLDLHHRSNVRCPRCRSFDRHRLLWLYLHERTTLFQQPTRLLHFAPEYVLQRRLRAVPDIDYVSADLYSPIAMVKTDIMDLQFPDCSFDALICYHVLEHVQDDKKAMRELFRVLKPGGWGIIQVPMENRPDTLEDPSITDPKERERLFGQFDHLRLYGLDYRDRLEEAGFAVQVDDYARKLPEATIRKYGLIRSEGIYYCTRPGS